jgi:amino acid permease
MAKKKPLSRDEVLGGLGGRATKQANAVLALIENRTAHLVAQSQQAANAAMAVAATQTTPRAYLVAIAQGRAELPRPTIQEIERYAEHWAMLVPENPAIRARLLHLLGQNDVLPAQTTTGIRAALGLDEEVVQQAYQRLYQQPISTLFAAQMFRWEGLRWRWATFSQRLENLPPFWLTFFLTMPAVSGLLALPIALANVGAFWGVLIILGLGLINMLTVAALAETVVRSGVARFGLGFLGQLSQEYLGTAATSLLTLALIVSNFLVLIIFFLGVGGTLSSATGLPAPLWMLLLLTVTLYFVSRRSLNATVTTNLLIVFVNLLIVGVILLLVLPAFQWRNLTASSGIPAFTPASLGSIVGILSATFLSHFLVATYGPVILPRDPGGQAWLRGSVAAVATMMIIAILWLLVIVGVLSPAALTEAKGTVVTPLAALVGPAVNLLGSVLVILSLGLATIQVSLAQYYSLEERLPALGSASWLGKLSPTQRLWLCASPMLAVLALALWLLTSRVGSFAGLLGTVNVLALPLLTGIIPMLLLVATRRMGDFVPGFAQRWLGHPLLVGLVVLFFGATILFHGLYIWEAWPLRLLAIGGGLAILAVSWLTWRKSTRAGRAVIEIRHDQRLRGQSHCNVVADGQPLAAAVTLHYHNRQEELHSAHVPIAAFPALQKIHLQLPAAPATSLKVWVHELPAEGGSIGLPAQVTLGSDQPQPDFHGATENGQILVPGPGRAQRVEIVLTA